LGTLFFKNPSSLAALTAMIMGGTITLVLIIINIALPYGLDANFFGISISAVTFLLIHNIRKANAEPSRT
jgi:SSS family solute:Na+ symporter